MGRADERSEVAMASDLAADARAAGARRVPLLVVFTAPDCGYCDRVLNEHLDPMQRDPAYRDKVVMRQVMLGSLKRLKDFSGKATTHDDFSRAITVRFAPTVKLYDAGGREVAEPLVGMTPAFYGAYLDRAIEQGLGRLRGNAPAR